MNSSGMYTRQERERVEHDRNFVKRARVRRRLKHIAAKQQRARIRRATEKQQFADWVQKMQRKAKEIWDKQLEKSELVPQRAEKY